jgi:hypothetical protein
LQDLYDRFYNICYGNNDSYDKYNKSVKSDVEIVFSPYLYRDTEDLKKIIKHNSIFNLDIYIKEYLVFDIKKFYGLSIKDYMSLTLIEREHLIEHANVRMQELKKEMDNISKNVKVGNKDMLYEED